MKISLLFLIVLFCGSCAGYRVSRFTTDPVKIGSPKELVLKKYGPPFKINSYNNGNKTLEVLYYKEPMVVARYEYILTTSLTFDDSILVKIEQEEELPFKRMRSCPSERLISSQRIIMFSGSIL